MIDFYNFQMPLLAFCAFAETQVCLPLSCLYFSRRMFVSPCPSHLSGSSKQIYLSRPSCMILLRCLSRVESRCTKELCSRFGPRFRFASERIQQLKRFHHSRTVRVQFGCLWHEWRFPFCNGHCSIQARFSMNNRCTEIYGKIWQLNISYINMAFVATTSCGPELQHQKDFCFFV